MRVSDRVAQDSPGLSVTRRGGFVAASAAFIAALHGGSRGR